MPSYTSATTATLSRCGLATGSSIWRYNAPIPMRQWAEPFVKLRVPYIMSLRRDPFERAEFNSNTYMDWMVDHVPQMYEMQAVIAAQIADFMKFPPRQRPASFNLDAVLAQVAAPHT